MRFILSVLFLAMVVFSCSKEEDDSTTPKKTDPNCFEVTEYTDQLPNMDFESWGFPDSSDGAYQDPCGGVWTSSNAVSSAFISQSTVLRTGNSNEGSFAAQIETKSFAGIAIFPAVLFTGRFKSYTFDLGDPLKDVEFGVPFTNKPTALTGMHTYTSVSEDSAYIAVYLSKYDAVNKKRDTVGFGEYTAFTSVLTYSPFTLNIDYSYTAGSETPDSVLVIYTSSKGFQDLLGSSGSKLMVDNCSFVY